MDLGFAIAGVGGKMAERELNDAAHNLANIATPGYKASRTAFSAYLVRALHGEAAYPSLDRQGFDLREGPVRATGRPLDVALHGPGFLVVRLPNGELALTRAGDLRLDGEGRLLAGLGYPLVNEANRPVRLPQGEVLIAPDGTIRVGGNEIAKLRLVEVADTGKLVRKGGGIWQAPPQAWQPAAHTRIQQGALEGSNVNAVLEITRIVQLTRHYDLEMRLVERYAEVDKIAATRVGVVQTTA